MLTDYLTDRINIISIAVDEWGVSQETTQADIAARVEDKNILVKDASGKEVVASMVIYIDDTLDVKYQDKIQIVTQNSQATQYPAKKWPIKHLMRAHGFSASHWEIYL